MDIQTLKAGKKYGFFKESAYGKNGTESGSYMDLQTAEKIVIECCTEYKKVAN